MLDFSLALLDRRYCCHKKSHSFSLPAAIAVQYTVLRRFDAILTSAKMVKFRINFNLVTDDLLSWGLFVFYLMLRKHGWLN